MSLHQYLLRIQENTAINLPKFVAALPEQHRLSWKNLFEYSKARGKDKYNLTVIDPVSFKQLLDNSSPSKDRADASNKGNSHAYKVSMSYLLVYPDGFNKANIDSNNVTTNNEQLNAQINNIPEVVICTNSALTIGFQPKKTLVIIENQENFFRYQSFLPYLFNDLNNSNPAFDVAFGSGNSVTNNMNSLYFNQYDEVLCCFDYDLGGLTMFSSLIKMTKAKVTFVMPSKSQLHDNEFLQKHFKKALKREDDKNWRAAIELAHELGFTDLAHAFDLTKKFMEQEVYLSDSF
ncbi:hypothetical protein [Colwellia sp. E2M01]|uniref:hypothetical protein n=1 Tax=Colwellia sp. E2M01 TaxID=2841561 RepID=UPI001C0A05B4|nr:hypothetical protein [Colwellia sp. E2M01]MBU2871362.1 hypothetical protein [Colwellia sp. E2M01]